jgi:hypothetical protein
MWHPTTEAEACSDLAAMLEWLRAARGMHALTPETILTWHATDPAGLDHALAAFWLTAPRTAEAIAAWNASR